MLDQQLFITRPQRVAVLCATLQSMFFVNAVMFSAEPERVDGYLIVSLVRRFCKGKICLLPCVFVLPATCIVSLVRRKSKNSVPSPYVRATRQDTCISNQLRSFDTVCVVRAFHLRLLTPLPHACCACAYA